jgi:hypothetical protein
MTDPNYTDIVVILDRSGSMATMDRDAAGGFNTFVEKQRQAPGRCTLTLCRFDGEFSTDYTAKPIADVPCMASVEPRGNTALYDAICTAIDNAGRRFALLPEDQRPGKVVVVVITDGHENASRYFTSAQVKERIEHQRHTYNWQFVFLGANQDAVTTGSSLGFSKGTSATFTSGMAMQAFAATAENISAYRCAASDASLSSYAASQRETMLGDALKP